MLENIAVLFMADVNGDCMYYLCTIILVLTRPNSELNINELTFKI